MAFINEFRFLQTRTIGIIGQSIGK